MNLLLFKRQQPPLVLDQECEVEIQDTRQLQHLQQILKAQIGQTLVLGEYNGLIGEGRLLAINNYGAKFLFRAKRQPPPALTIHLLLALPRPRMLARTLENISTLGVKQLTLLQTKRVEKSFWQSPLLQKENLAKHCQLGLEQAQDTIMPKIYCAPHFHPFIKSTLPKLLIDYQGLIAHPSSINPLPKQTSDQRPLLIAIGPEGGFIDQEINLLSQANMHSFHMGVRILRVETAVVALLARLSALN